MHDRLSASDITTATVIILVTSDTVGCYYHSLTRTTFCYSWIKVKEKPRRCANDGYHGENLYRP